MPPTPSSIISDALNSLSKATSLALATVEDQARGEVAHANAEAAEARNERDGALKALHAMQLEQKEWKRREDGWKAVIDKSEMTVQHQAETIVHLTAEAQQWKTQLIRLGDTSRQEIIDWKEQYLRAEQERCRLSSRIDELVAEQLAWNTQANTNARTATPRATYPGLYEPSTSLTATKRATSSSLTAVHKHTPLARPPRLLDDDSDSLPPPVPLRKAQAGHTPAKARQERERGASSPTRPAKARNMEAPVAFTSKVPPRTPRTSSATVTPGTVIRRVHAVIEVPVKEEEESDREGFASDGSIASGTPYEPERGRALPARTPTKRVSRQSRQSGRGKQTPTQAKRQQAPEEFEYEDEEEPPSKPNKKVRRPVEQDEDEDEDDEDEDDDIDELVMGAGDEGMESYPVQQEITSKNQCATAPARATGRKRKLDGGTSTPARGATAKVARKK